MPRTRRHLRRAAPVLLVALAAGCGGSAGSTATTVAPGATTVPAATAPAASGAGESPTAFCASLVSATSNLARQSQSLGTLSTGKASAAQKAELTAFAADLETIARHAPASIAPQVDDLATKYGVFARAVVSGNLTQLVTAAGGFASVSTDAQAVTRYITANCTGSPKAGAG